MKLSDILRGSAPALSPARPANTRKLETAIKRVDETFPDIAPTPSAQDRESVARAFQRRIETWNWEGCTVENAASAARAAFAADLRERDDLAILRDFMLAEADASTRGAVLRAILDVHIDSYEQKTERTRRFARAMTRRRAHLPVRSRETIGVLPEVLDAARGGTALGQRMAAAGDAAAPFAGLAVIPSGGLVDTASASFVAALAPRMAEEAVARRVLDWFAPEGGRARAVGAEAAIDALLSPWHREEPPAARKRLLLDRLVAAYDDPRITPGGAWGRVREDTSETFIRWQTGATLEAFLDIVTQAEKKHMWADRMPFWRDLYHEGHIQDACVALSGDAHAIARNVEARAGKASLGRYGRQVAGGEDKIKSLLIMKINGKTVVEGSYNFQVHIFPDNHPKKPILHKPNRYDCREIRDSLPYPGEDKKAHDKGGKWKIWTRKKTGCPL